MTIESNEVINLIIKQLQFYGLNAPASVLSEAATGRAPSHSPSNQLAQWLEAGKLSLERQGIQLSKFL
jgi:hypothetical protein